MLVRRNKGEWQEPEVKEYPSESELQRMIAESPSLMPGIDGQVPVAREFRCHFGKIDIVAVDLNGRITLCECKTEQNPELRRKVVGQIFAYAAALSSLTWEAFAHRFERASGTGLVDRAQALADETDEGAWDEEAFRQETGRCLEAGDFRLVLAVEAIPEELRETVRFLNVHSSSGLEVLALELSYRRDGDLEILVPHTWGEETAKPGPGGRPRRIDRETLVDRIGEQTRAAEATEAILDWAESEPKLQVRYTTRQAVIETPPPRRSFLYISESGNIHVELKTLRKHADSWSDESSKQLVQDLKDIGVHLDTTRSSPKAPAEPLADEARGRRFFELMERARKALAG